MKRQCFIFSIIITCLSGYIYSTQLDPFGLNNEASYVVFPRVTASVEFSNPYIDFGGHRHAFGSERVVVASYSGGDTEYTNDIPEPTCRYQGARMLPKGLVLSEQIKWFINDGCPDSLKIADKLIKYLPRKQRYILRRDLINKRRALRGLPPITIPVPGESHHNLYQPVRR